MNRKSKQSVSKVASHLGMSAEELKDYVAKFAIDALSKEIELCGKITLPLKFANLNAQRRALTDEQKSELAGITSGKELLAFTNRLSKEGRVA